VLSISDIRWRRNQSNTTKRRHTKTKHITTKQIKYNAEIIAEGEPLNVERITKQKRQRVDRNKKAKRLINPPKGAEKTQNE